MAIPSVIGILAAFEARRVQMRRFGTWLLIALGSLAVLLAIAITLTIGWSPFLGPKRRALTNRIFERTPQRLERGRYIATALSVYCHTPHDWTAPNRNTVMVLKTSGATANVRKRELRAIDVRFPDPSTVVSKVSRIIVRALALAAHLHGDVYPTSTCSKNR
jgi:hypothetical protein